MVNKVEPFIPAIWNVLHDGCIEQIDGNLPGEIRIVVSIEYLRERFQEDGDTFVVTLRNCTEFSHRIYEHEQATSDLGTIANESLSILSAQMHEKICRVFTDVGVIELVCDGGTIALDSGRKITLEKLIAVAESYWDEWESKSKSP
ncbi:MAG: hypothetical protein AAF623_00945 [Planctomycetota bacterium]